MRQQVSQSGAGTLKLLLSILWSSFLVAAAANGLFFSVFDPVGLLEPLNETRADLPLITFYTFGFFCCWAGGALTSMLSCYLVITPKKA